MKSQRLKSWWTHLTWQQVVLAVAAMVGTGLLMRHVPVDNVKDYVTLIGGLLAAGGVGGSLLNGRRAEPVRAEPPA
jgi:hypothetical protein